MTFPQFDSIKKPSKKLKDLKVWFKDFIFKPIILYNLSPFMAKECLTIIGKLFSKGVSYAYTNIYKWE